MNWRLLMLVAAPSVVGAQAIDSLLVLPTRDVHCAPIRTDTIPAHLVIPGAIEREYDIPETGMLGRYLRVSYDSAGRTRRFFAVRTTSVGMQTIFVPSASDTLSAGFRTEASIDSTRLRGIGAPSQDEVRSAITTRTTPVTATDRESAARLAASLWRVPCDSRPASVDSPETLIAPDLNNRVELTAPFIVVVVDSMPAHAPPGARGTVVRRPGHTPVDAIVIRRDAMTLATLDTMLTMLRVVRTMDPAPDRLLAVSASAGVAPADSAFASRVLADLVRASARDVHGVGRGPAIDVPALESRPGLMIRRRSPPD